MEKSDGEEKNEVPENPYDIYDSPHTVQDAHAYGARVRLSELERGTVIETQENSDPAPEEQTWWSKEELLEHLKDNPFGADGDDDFATFRDKIDSGRMTCLQENGVWKRTIRQSTGLLVVEKCAVLFHYNAYLEGGDEPFDSSVLRGKPFLNRMDQGFMIPGLYIGLMSMKEGEKAEILIAPPYGFGELGCPPRIPGDSYLLYIVEVLKIFPEGSIQDYELMTAEELAKIPFEQIMDECNRQRISGNTYFKSEKYREAGNKYMKAITFLERYFYKTPDQQKQGHDLLGKLYPNMAAVYIKLRKPRSAMVVCRKAITLDPKNLKALYNYGRAKYQNGNYDEARDYFNKCIEISPSNISVIEQLRKIEKRKQEDDLASKELYEKIGKKFF